MEGETNGVSTRMDRQCFLAGLRLARSGGSRRTRRAVRHWGSDDAGPRYGFGSSMARIQTWGLHDGPVMPSGPSAICCAEGSSWESLANIYQATRWPCFTLAPFSLAHGIWTSKS